MSASEAVASLPYIDRLQQSKGGFVFDNFRRNNRLESMGVKWPEKRKTGTTICAIVVKDAVILAADTRATEGPIVADKNAEKLHKIASRIYCAGAGTSADLDHVTHLISSNVELHRLDTNREPRITTVVSMLSQMLFKYQGHVGCHLLLGGVDFTGPHLYKVHPHGSTDWVPFDSMGSGSLNALAVLEARYKDNMSIEEGKELAVNAIRCGIFNDLGSGSNVDVCVIEKDKTTYLRNIDVPNPRPFRMPQQATFKTGTTEVLRQNIEHIKQHVVVEEVTMSDD